MRAKLPAEFEQVVLLTLAGFKREATGRDVYEALVATTGRDVSVAAIHITLTRLVEKGWVVGASIPQGSGERAKPRRRYRLAAAGAEVLWRQRAQLDRLWGLAADHPLFGLGAK